MAIAFFFVLAWNAHAGTIQECNEARKQDIKLCQDDLESTQTESASSNGQIGKASTGARMQEGGNIMSAAYTSEAQRWAKLADSCQKKLDDCQRKCKVEPQYQNYADQYADQCRQKIGKIIRAAYTSAENNESGAVASTASSSAADSQQAAEQRQVASNQRMNDEVLGADGRPVAYGQKEIEGAQVQNVGDGVNGSYKVNRDGSVTYVGNDPGGGATVTTYQNGRSESNSYNNCGQWIGGKCNLRQAAPTGY